VCEDSEICKAENACLSNNCEENPNDPDQDCCEFDECQDSEFCIEKSCLATGCIPEDTCCELQVCADAFACSDREEPPVEDTCDSIVGMWFTVSTVDEDLFNEVNFVNDPCVKGAIGNQDGTLTFKSDSGIDQTGIPEVLPNGDCFVHAEGIGFQAGFNAVKLISDYIFFLDEFGQLRVNGTSQYDGNPFPQIGFLCIGLLEGVEGDY